MLAADPPAAVTAPAPAPADKPSDIVVISRDSKSEVLVSKDTPLPLGKARRSEDAVLRQAVFLTSTLTVVRPAAATSPGDEVLRWTFQPYLQRQLCFTSITGLFSCAAADVEELADRAAGEAPLAAPPGRAAPIPNAAANDARNAVAAALRARAAALFDDDRRRKLEPMLKAAGVTVRTAGPSRR